VEGKVWGAIVGEVETESGSQGGDSSPLTEGLVNHVGKGKKTGQKGEISSR